MKSSKWLESSKCLVHSGLLPRPGNFPRLGCQKHIGKRSTRLTQNFHIHTSIDSKKGANLCSICLEARRNREKQHSIWFVPTGMNGLPQNILLYFELECLKSNLTIYLPSGISEIFCQMVSSHGLLCSFF